MSFNVLFKPGGMHLAARGVASLHVVCAWSLHPCALARPDISRIPDVLSEHDASGKPHDC